MINNGAAMSNVLHEFVGFWQQHQPRFSEQLYADLIVALPNYATLPREQLLASIDRKAVLWHNLLQTGDIAPILERTTALVQQRVGNHFPMTEMARTGDYFTKHLLRLLDEYYQSIGQTLPLAVIEQIERWSLEDRDVVLTAYSAELERIRGSLAARVQQLEEQQVLIDALAVPIVPLTAETLLLPLVGSIDGRRATKIMEAALEQVVAFQAERLIIDITGVSMIDRQTAHYLSQTAQAIRMVGARTVVVGINAQVALMLTHEEISFGDITVYANLRMALGE
jgi:anti-anti-sigma regulatory factor